MTLPGQLSPDEGEVRAGAPPALRVERLGKSFPGQRALVDLDLTIAPGEVHALLGENGSGKSTVIKILAGYHKPDHGASVHLAGEELSFGDPHSAYRLGARFVHQDLGLVDSMSVADNLFLVSGFPRRFGTVRRREQLALASASLELAGVDVDPTASVGSLPPAMRTGVAVARALGVDPKAAIRLLVMDEPTATLPDHEVSELLSIIKGVARRGVAVIYVTHRTEEVFEISDIVTVLRDGRKVGTAPTASLSRQDLIAMLVGTELETPTVVSEGTISGDREMILKVEDLHSGPLRGISFQGRSGEVVGIAGLTGSGREVLLASVFGGVGRQRGTVAVGGRALPPGSARAAVKAGVAYVPADRKALGAMMLLSARENLTIADLAPFWSGITLKRSAEEAEAAKWFQRLQIRPRGGVELAFEFFSGGNQQKILLGKWLRCSPRLLLLDEPTQGVDVAATAELHRQLLNAAHAGASVVVSSSDAEELATLCHRVLVVKGGRFTAELRGTELTTRNITRYSLGLTEDVS